MNLSQFVSHLAEHGVIPQRDTFFTQDKDGKVFEWRSETMSCVKRTGNSWKPILPAVVSEFRGDHPQFSGWHMRVISITDFSGLIPDLNEVKSAVHRDILDARTYINKRDHAAEKGQDFTISLGEWLDLRKVYKCPVTGLELEFDAKPGDSRIPDNKWTVDRIDPRKGYIPGNVIAMSFLANSAKGMVDSLITHRDLTTVQKLALLNDALLLLQQTLQEESGYDGSVAHESSESGDVSELEREY